MAPARISLAEVCSSVARTPINSVKQFEKWWPKFAAWPPNAFALTSLLLERSGVYRLAVSPPESEQWPPSINWEADVRRIANRWRKISRGSSNRLPPRIREIGTTISGALDMALSEMENDWSFCQALLELHTIADESCAGVGIPEENDEEDTMFIHRANQKLASGSLSEVDGSIVRVLPKLRTPQVGITLRSLSQHLAAHSGEVTIHWSFHEDLVSPSDLRLNVLLLPLPLRIEPSDFSPVEGPLANLDRRNYGFFAYSPRDPATRASVVNDAIQIIDAAKRKCPDIHMVVLPECAVHESERKRIRQEAFNREIKMIVSGIHGDQKNYAYFGMKTAQNAQREFEQHKHHRWCLNKTQILQYALGSALHPSRRWWEHIRIPNRELHFVTANEWLTVCHLICEDLARQDPVASVIRGVGPTLLIALLMDGPQLASRWSSRYATTLADDPGCSVLSLTSLGMSLRSRPDGLPPSRVIGLWKERSGRMSELTLEPPARGLLVTLCARWVQEWSADGRGDGESTSELFLGGVEQIV